MHQFFVEPYQIQGKMITILGEDVKHIKNVLRIKIGEEIAVSNGQDRKEYRCAVTALEEDKVICELRFIREEGVELPSQVYLFQSLPKADKMELIIQKAVELGVYQVIPVAAKRCIVKLEEKKAKAKIVRWQEIAKAAAKQSKRQIIPQVTEVMSFEEAIQKAADMEIKIIPYELAEGMNRTRQLMNNLKPGQRIAIFIGPEGGFEETEITMALGKGICPITLGKGFYVPKQQV